jgi:hypothetical protein
VLFDSYNADQRMRAEFLWAKLFYFKFQLKKWKDSFKLILGRWILGAGDE